MFYEEKAKQEETSDSAQTEDIIGKAN